MNEDWIKGAFSELEEREYQAFCESISNDPAAFLINCVEIAGKEYLDPLAKMLVETGNEKRFAKLTQVMSILAFHMGWAKKTEADL